MGSRFQHGRPADSPADRPDPEPARTSNAQLDRPARPTSLPLRGLRLFRLALHLVNGMLKVLVLFPSAAQHRRQRMRQRWSAKLLKILGIRLQCDGPPVRHGCLLVANHVSWLDVFVINALIPVGFVSKAEVRRWPCIGWLAARNDTLFLHRGNRTHAERVSREIANRLKADHNIAVFPEGMTTDGTSVRYFHGKLLQPAITHGCPVQPLAIRYRTPEDRYCAAAAYAGGLTLLQSLKAIAAEPAIIARVHQIPATTPEPGTDRRELANRLRQQIASRVEENGG